MTTTIHSLKVRHFQSLHDVSLDLAAFTVIVGPSSSGKSALARALRTLVSNRRGTEWITHGERVASISAETNDGTVTLTRSRSTASAENSYTLIPLADPEALRTYSKLGGDTPEDVSRFLGIPSGTVSQPPLNFAGQFDKPFLLDDSAAEVARTLGALTNVNIIFEAARESNRRKLSQAGVLKVKASELEQVKARIPEFQSLKAQDEGLSLAEDKITEARGLERKIARLTEYLGIIETTEPTIERLRPLAELEVPSADVVVQAATDLQGFQQALSRIPTLNKVVQGAEEAFTAAEDDLSQVMRTYAELTGSITEDIAAFFKASVDPKYVLAADGVSYVESGHAVQVFLQYLEVRSES